MGGQDGTGYETTSGAAHKHRRCLPFGLLNPGPDVNGSASDRSELLKAELKMDIVNVTFFGVIRLLSAFKAVRVPCRPSLVDFDSYTFEQVCISFQWTTFSDNKGKY